MNVSFQTSLKSRRWCDDYLTNVQLEEFTMILCYKLEYPTMIWRQLSLDIDKIFKLKLYTENGRAEMYSIDSWWVHCTKMYPENVFYL